MISHQKIAVMATILYAIPKGLTYLCTKPEAEAQSILDLFKERMAYLQEETKVCLGNKGWFVLTDVIADNGWIAYVVFRYLTNNQKESLFQNFDKTLDTTAALISFCTASWLIRFGVVKAFPWTRSFIATRSHS